MLPARLCISGSRWIVSLKMKLISTLVGVLVLNLPVEVLVLKFDGPGVLQDVADVFGGGGGQLGHLVPQVTHYRFTLEGCHALLFVAVLSLLHPLEYRLVVC